MCTENTWHQEILTSVFKVIEVVYQKLCGIKIYLNEKIFNIKYFNLVHVGKLKTCCKLHSTEYMNVHVHKCSSMVCHHEFPVDTNL